MTESEILRIRNIIANHEDIKKCNEYQIRISNGDYQCVHEALAFTNKKYAELCVTDKDIIIANGVVSTSNSIDQNIVNRALKNLECIKNLLVAKIIKNNVKN